VVEVVKVVDLSEAEHVERELMLVKIRAEGDARAEVKRTADIFRGQIIDVTPNGYTVQLSGPTEKLDAFIRAVGKLSILEVARTGVTGIGRGDKVLGI
jgi:acetolactate synthase-1/3 small subunit